MPKTQETADSFKQLFAEVKKYAGLQVEYVKVEAVEKMAVLVSTLIIVGVILVLVFAVLFYLSFSLAYVMEPLLGSLALGFVLVSAFYVMLIAIFVIFRRRLVINPLVRFLSHLFLNK